MNAQPLTDLPRLTPSRLATIDRCRLEHHAKYVLGQWGDERFAPALARHNVTHAALRQVLDLVRRQRPLPDDLLPLVEAEQRRPRHRYPDESTREADAETILAWVGRGIAWIAGAAKVLGVEQDYEYRYPGSADCQGFVLAARVDLVREHGDGTVEVVDWKTGSVSLNLLQVVSGRIVVGHAYPRRPIRNTVVYLAADRDHDYSAILTDAEVRAGRREIKDLSRAVWAEEEPSPTAHAFCPSCPLYRRGCPLRPSVEELDPTTEWLEGAA